jgi:uncharacterized membrane protein
MLSGTSMLTGMGWPGLVLLLVLWGGALALILWGSSSRFPAGRSTTATDALTILQQRYARGEISREEFLQASETIYQPEPAAYRHTHHHLGPK